MKKRIITLLILLTGAFTLNLAPVGQVFAGKCGDIETTILDCKDGEDGVTHVLKLTIDILSIGIGVLGVVGISIVGIQYLTAGGNEEKTRKAKRRMFEIVIGLVAYAVIYAFLKFLLPNFGG